MRTKVVRYTVCPHRNRGGGFSRYVWDVREIIRDEFGIEHDAGNIDTVRTRKEAQAYADKLNDDLRLCPERRIR